MVEIRTLGWVDYLVIAFTLCVSAVIGIYYRFTGGRQKTMEEYFIASRTMGIAPVAIALVATTASAVALLGMSSEIYTYGTQLAVINLSGVITTPIVCYGFLPVFYKLRATSVYEYLEKRFGLRTRMMASFIYWIQLFSHLGIVLYAPSLALEATTGMSKTASILTIGVVCAFYSFMGGIKAVLVNDIFQTILMFAAIFAVIVTAAINVGGLGQIWEIAKQGQRIEFANISVDPTIKYTLWSVIIGSMISHLSIYGANQTLVQRVLTVKNMKAAQTAVWLACPILGLLIGATCLSGLAIYSKYYNCDPSLEGRITSPDMLMPLFVMDTMSSVPGLPGLFIAGIFSASLSTVSAGLNSLSAVTLEDYAKPIYRKITGRELTAVKSTTIAKIFTVTFGIVAVALAFLAQLLGGLLQASFIIVGIIGGPLLGLFTLGMGTESATEGGVIIGTLTSMIFLIWISFGQPRPVAPTLSTTVEGCGADYVANATISVLQNVTNLSKSTGDSSYFYLYRISYMWYSTIGFVISFTVGLLVSNLFRMFFKYQQDDLDSNLFFPIIARRMHYKRCKSIETNVTNGTKLETKYFFNNANIENNR